MEKYINSFDDTKIYYVHKKNKNPHTLIFIHGIGVNWTVWRKEIDFFSKKGYSVLAPDLRGHGLSEWPHDEKKYDYLNFTKDIRSIIKKENIKEFTLIGHSLGGAISITYCELFKDMPNSMVLVDTAHRYPFKYNHEFNLNPFIIHVLRFLSKHEDMRNIHFPHMTENKKEIKNFGKDHKFLFELFYHTPLKCVFKCMDTINEHSKKCSKDIEKLLHELDIPVLIITASKDKLIDPKFSNELHDLIKNSQLKVINNAHHLVPVEKPDEINKNIWNFLKLNNKNHIKVK
ncbi:MAG: alpha/beta hydrolase [Candidatus Woesearchaeota archaeon]